MINDLDILSLKKELKRAPKVKADEVLKEIECKEGKFDVNEKRCMPCEFYDLVWDGEAKMCKIADKESIKVQKKCEKFEVLDERTGMCVANEEKKEVVNKLDQFLKENGSTSVESAIDKNKDEEEKDKLEKTMKEAAEFMSKNVLMINDKKEIVGYMAKL